MVNPVWVRTPLTEPLIAHPGFRDAVLEPEAVVHPVVEQVMSGKSGQLILPKEVNFVSTVRGWPSWMQESLRKTVAYTLDLGVSIAPKN